jgi:hypothetical protein
MQNQALGLTTAVTLSWAAPTQNTDGSPVTFEGFNVYRSSTPAIVRFADGGPVPLAGGVGNAIPPTQLTYTDHPPDGTWYYAVSAWHVANGQGMESDLTPVVSFTGSTTPPVPKTATTPAVPGKLQISVTGSA